MRGSCRFYRIWFQTLAVCILLGLPLAPTFGAIVVVDQILSDNGDDDGFADTNETVGMRITVLNTSGENLTGVIARLRAADNTQFCVTSPLISIGDLAAGETLTTSTAFSFKVAENLQREGSCSLSLVTCSSGADCTGGAGDSCDAIYSDLSALVDVAFAWDGSGGFAEEESLTLDLDLDPSGGAGPSSYFESFESAVDFGSFTTMNLDAGRHSPSASDGFRCQYHDVDFTNSNSYGNTSCYLGSSPAQADAYYWQVDGPGSAEPSRSFSGVRSLYMGQVLGEGLGFTTPFRTLEAIRSDAPVNLGYAKVCAESRSISCLDGVDCPGSESCVDATPTLSFKHQISLGDSRSVNVIPGESADRGVVHVQLADAAGDPVGDWVKLFPYKNRYDQQATDGYSNCMFDPVDDGNNEESFFDPLDPDRRLGPSSTCYPAFSFVYLGDTDEFCTDDCLGNAEIGPGEQGATGTGTWIESAFDLTRYRGRRLRVRFVETTIEAGTTENWEEIFGLNPDPGDDGWWIDDVTISDTLTQPAVLSSDITDNSGLPGQLPDSDGDGAFDQCDNCPAVINGGQEDQDGDLIGDVCDLCPEEFVNDADGDGLCCPLDNCCADYNPDQLDGDGDGAGDLCDVNPVFLVSQDPADDPDFFTVIDAIQGAYQSGTLIRIMPSDLAYDGSAIDRNMLFRFEGVDDGSGREVIIDSGFSILSTLGTASTSFRNMTIRGSAWGVRSSFPVTIVDCTFSQAPASAIDLFGPGHLIRGVEIKGSLVSRGIWIHEGGAALIEDVRIRDISGRGVRVGGDVVLRGGLIVNTSSDGVFVTATGTLDLSHATISGIASGLLVESGGSATIAHSILYGNTTDLAGLPCTAVSWSDIGTIDCSALNNNLSVDPLFAPTLELSSGSPALDHGPSPASYSGLPFRDLNGGPRLRDHDGDGLARIDIGAFERENTSLLPGTVEGLEMPDKNTLNWSPVDGALEYHVYRGALASLDYSYFGDCRDDLDPDRSDLLLVDTTAPTAGGGLFYTISAESAGGAEGTLGVGSSAERSNFTPCP